MREFRVPSQHRAAVACPGLAEKRLAPSFSISTPWLHRSSGRREREALGLMKLSLPLAEKIGPLEGTGTGTSASHVPHQAWTGHRAGFLGHQRAVRKPFPLLTARVPLSSFLLSSADLCQGMREVADRPGSRLRFDVYFLWAPGLTTEGCPEEVCWPHPESLTERPLAFLQLKVRHSGGGPSVPRLPPVAAPPFSLQSPARQRPGPSDSTDCASAETSAPWRTCCSWVYSSHIWEAGLPPLQTERPLTGWGQVFCCAEAGDKLAGYDPVVSSRAACGPVTPSGT